jgi:hypothetical protein
MERTTARSLALLTLLAGLLTSGSALAFDFGFGVEGAGTLTLSKNLSGSAQTSTSAGLGLILEERFSLVAVELTLWEDVQTPYTLNTAMSNLPVCTFCSDIDTASFVPLDAGLRLGLGFSPFRPYVGVLVNDNILTSSTASATGNWFGIGGDLGIDIKVIFLRFGLDLRALWSVTDVNPSSAAPPATYSGGALVLQGILSARFSF